MEEIMMSNRFFGLTLKPNTLHKRRMAQECRLLLSGVSLSASNTSTERHIVQIWTGDELEDKHVIARLIPGVIETISLDLLVDYSSGAVAFSVTGPGEVDLVGNLSVPDLSGAEEEEEEEEEEGSFPEEPMMEEEQESVDQEEQEESSSSSSLPEEPTHVPTKRKAPEPLEDSEEGAAPEPVSERPTKRVASNTDIMEALRRQKRAMEEPKLNKEERREARAEERRSRRALRQGWVPVQGVKVREVESGSGPDVRPGDMVSVRYVGRLTDEDGTMFDSNLGKKPFKFRVGANQVIPGMDIAVMGMQVGGVREVSIPPRMGYGRSRTGPIPPNSTLYFKIEMLKKK